MAVHSHVNFVPITAFATICGSGTGNDALYQTLLQNRTVLGQLSLFKIPFATPVAEVMDPLPEINPRLNMFNSRNARMALAALDSVEDGLREAVERAKSCYGNHRVGVVIGTSTSGLYETETAYEILIKEGHMPDDFFFLNRHAYQATPRFLQNELGLDGPCYAISTACSSAAKAIAAGQRLLVNDVCDAVLVGGVDTLCRLTLRGFRSLELVSRENCKPMDRERDGINIGEGAGLLLLEKPGGHNVDSLQVMSVGESSDAHHMSSPHPEGLGAALAMSSALKIAGLDASSIDYINLHATATRINDKIESKAVYNVFSDSVPCSGTKGITGHTLGAAGAIEAIIALLAIKHQFLPGTCGLDQVDENFQCKVIKDPVLNQNINTVMSNSFGFGGNNASMIFAAPNE